MRRIAALGLLALVVGASSHPVATGAREVSRPQTYDDVTWQPVMVDPVIPTITPTVAPRPQPIASPIVVPAPAPRVAIAPASPTVAQAQAWALATLGSTQYACLANIVKHEDGTWDPTRMAPNGAYGIPQALPGTKMATAGSDWRTNRITQLRWMIGYVDGRYGSACGAWSFWQAHYWY